MPDTTPDRAAAYLEEVRVRLRNVVDAARLKMDISLSLATRRSARDVPRLLAAVEAALARHVRQETPVRSWDLDLRCPAHNYAMRAIPSFTEVRDCPDCTYRDRYVCQNPDCREHEWPCPDYLAITTALLREVPGA
jgi:hypothetical protein